MNFEFFKTEPLCDELAAYVAKLPKLGPCLRHPLVYAVPYCDAMNAYYNRQLREKQRAIVKATSEGRWDSIIALHERPYRLAAFLDVRDHLTGPAYWETLGWIWTDSENIWQHLPTWRDLLTANVSGRERFMDAEERAHLAELPDALTVHRGYQKGRNFDGLSYTLDRGRAEWFARRFAKGNRAAVRTRTVRKADVFAYLNGRGEREVILL